MKNKVIRFLLCMTCLSGTIMMSDKSKAKEEEVEEVFTVGDEIEANKRIQIVEELNIESMRDEMKSQFAFKQKNDTKEIVVISENKSKNCELLQFPQLSDEDIYYLKKIATCEAGNQSAHTMSLVILVVLNRVSNPKFPNSVYEVIMQHNSKTYQFSVCRPGHEWYYTEPSEKSEEAFNMVWDSLYDYSDGALFFENIGSDEKAANSWFGRELRFLYKSEDIRFYKYK